MIVFKWFFKNNSTFEEFLKTDQNKVCTYAFVILPYCILHQYHFLLSYQSYHYANLLASTHSSAEYFLAIWTTQGHGKRVFQGFQETQPLVKISVAHKAKVTVLLIYFQIQYQHECVIKIEDLWVFSPFISQTELKQ